MCVLAYACVECLEKTLGLDTSYPGSIFFYRLSAICRPYQIPINMNYFSIYMPDLLLILQPTQSTSCPVQFSSVWFCSWPHLHCAPSIGFVCVHVVDTLSVGSHQLPTGGCGTGFHFCVFSLASPLLAWHLANCVASEPAEWGQTRWSPSKRQTDRTWAFLFWGIWQCRYCYSLLSKTEKFVCVPEYSLKCISKGQNLFSLLVILPLPLTPAP